MEKIFIGWNWVKFSAGIKKLTFRSSSYSAIFDMLWNRDHWPKSVQTWRNWKISFPSEKLGIFTYFDQSKSFYSYFWYPKLVREEKKIFGIFGRFFDFLKIFPQQHARKNTSGLVFRLFSTTKPNINGFGDPHVTTMVTSILHPLLRNMFWFFASPAARCKRPAAWCKLM